jgi:hypothetical protein
MGYLGILNKKLFWGNLVVIIILREEMLNIVYIMLGKLFNYSEIYKNKDILKCDKKLFLRLG